MLLILIRKRNYALAAMDKQHFASITIIECKRYVKSLLGLQTILYSGALDGHLPKN